MSGRPWRCHGLLATGLAAVALLATAAVSSAEAPAAGLHALTRVRLTVEITRAVDGLAADELRKRLAEALRDAAPAVAAEADAADRLRLRVALEPRSATELRGFWLPFSGTYAIGLIGLAVERPVLVSGAGDLTTAIVWREDRVVAVPWRAAAAEVRRATDAMLDALLAARPRP